MQGTLLVKGETFQHPPMCVFDIGWHKGIKNQEKNINNSL